jgi:hypothetical protein
MTTNQTRSSPLNTSRVLVLSDNEILGKVAVLLLALYPGMQVWRLRIDQELEVLQSYMYDHFDLVVLLLSSATRDPLACLARAGLEAVWEKTPLIVSSGRQPPVNSAGNMTQIGFPFEIDGLQAAIRGVLGSPISLENQARG